LKLFDTTFLVDLVSATAFYNELTLVTRNIEHFKRISNLNVETY